MLSIRKATVDDVFMFVRTIDPMDLDELEAMQPGRDLMEELTSYLDGENVMVCVDEEGFVYSYGGITPTEHGAAVWFLTSIALRDASRSVIKDYIKLMGECRDETLKRYGRIFNYIWNGNKRHKYFIRKLGGVFHDIYQHSEHTGQSFQLFTIE